MSPVLLLAQEPTRTYIELARIESPLDWALPIGVLVAVSAFVVCMYLADCRELGRRYAAALILLRLTALVGLFVVYLKPERRTDQQVVKNSRVVILIDTSQSMGVVDPGAGPENRLEQVRRELEGGRLLPQLRDIHEVSVAQFNSRISPVETFPPLASAATANSKQEDAGRTAVTPEQNSGDDVSSAGWDSILPTGSETRLGEALRTAIEAEQGRPTAGIVLISDGGQNAGVGADVGTAAAVAAGIPVYTVGLGSDRLPSGVRLKDLTAPERVLPKDGFNISAFIQATRLGGRTGTIRLSREAKRENEPSLADEILSLPFDIPVDGEVLTIEIPVTGLEQIGTHTFRVDIESSDSDANPADNSRTVDVEVTDAKTNVLLIASGPSRDYVFLRNQLHRDPTIDVDVWLQSGVSGISQDARNILPSFPDTREQLFAYDGIVAFDANWRELADDQLQLLEDWVAEQAGGLVVVAGEVEMDRSIRESRLKAIRDLLPVEFQPRFSRFDAGPRGASEPTPVSLTPEGADAEFLWLGNTAAAGRQGWARFPGVYGAYEVKGPKPGATVYAQLVDAADVDGTPAVFLAGHFFGSGRVMFLASGEIWRMRAVDETYFEQFYTKLIRHVAQGRLLRGSDRGLLFVEQDRYSLGDTVQVRARLFDAKFEPLTLPEIRVELSTPAGPIESKLSADRDREGMYAGQFAALFEGSYEISLTIPESQGEILSRSIQVVAPDLETDNAVRRDDILSAVARETGGKYYVGMAAVNGEGGMPPLAAQLKDRTLVTYVTGAPDRLWEETWMRWALGGICGALGLEWLLRRLWRLA